MTIDLDKLADEVAGAVLDVIEEERRINRSDISSAVKKSLKPLLEKPTLYGGFGVGAFTAVGDGVHVYRMSRFEPPLLPDGD